MGQEWLLARLMPPLLTLPEHLPPQTRAAHPFAGPSSSQVLLLGLGITTELDIKTQKQEEHMLKCNLSLKLKI